MHWSKLPIKAEVMKKMAAARVGRRLSTEHRQNIRKAMKLAYQTGKVTGLQPGAKKGKTVPERRRRELSEQWKGKLNPHWKGGVSKENKEVRQLMMGTLEYRLWREAVYERDGYACRRCLRTDERLNADHIKPWILYPELGLAINNGQTLCVPCHKEKTKEDQMLYHVRGKNGRFKRK